MSADQNPQNSTAGWIDGEIGVEVQPMGVPKPIGYGVTVGGKVVATLTPEKVEAAYRKFLALAEARERANEKYRRL